MTKHIVIIQGQPDPAGEHLGRELASAYAEGASQAGHELRTIEVARLEFPLLQTAQQFETGSPPPCIEGCQRDVRWADHLLLVYPLWLGTMPAVLKGFLEQLLRPGSSMDGSDPQRWPRKLLKGRSARILLTMGMPAAIYRWYYRAHSLKSLERNILGLCGIKPVHETLIGGVESLSDEDRRRWLERLRALGEAGN